MGYSLNGLGMARPTYKHIAYNRNIILNYYLQTKFEEYEALQEPAIDLANSYDGYVPDVAFYKTTKNGLITMPEVVIEIEKTENIEDAAMPKIKKYFEKYKCKEVFILDYESLIWYKYELPYYAPSEFDFSSYSDVLDIDLDNLLELPNLSLFDFKGIKPSKKPLL